jgi:hypothetical protein
MWVITNTKRIRNVLWTISRSRARDSYRAEDESGRHVITHKDLAEVERAMELMTPQDEDR